jgi:hypothetical protein
MSPFARMLDRTYVTESRSVTVTAAMRKWMIVILARTGMGYAACCLVSWPQAINMLDSRFQKL